MDDDFVQLLDTPKKLALDGQASDLKAVLKDFERSFAAEHDGKKPNKDDIKANAFIAAKYKEYSKIRDVLAGKLSLQALTTHSPSKRKRHSRNDSETAWTPRKRHQANTPRKSLHAVDLDPYDAPTSVSPRRQYMTAVGPTPHRDGKVLGLFDLLATPTSRSSAQRSPFSSLKLEARNGKRLSPGAVEQTPRRTKSKHEGDILEHLTGTPSQEINTSRKRHSRTPASEGRKFLLSQLFATPSAARFSNVANVLESAKKTPLRDMVLGTSPEAKCDQVDGDATPGYLRRSVSFKDRLLSATQSAEVSGLKTKPAYSTGPPTLRHFRSAARLIQHQNSQPEDVEYEDEDEDEMEALREMEENEVNVLAAEDPSRQPTNANQDAGQTGRVYKKKGQKRTTRKSMMRPTMTKAHEAPTFVAADDDDEDYDDDETNRDIPEDEEQSQRPRNKTTGGINDSTDRRRRREASNKTSKGSKSASNDKWDKLAAEVLKPKKKSDSGQSSSRTVNPNAYSHMNFRSLKIKNKNSRAKGAGRGRFGRGRR